MRHILLSNGAAPSDENADVTKNATSGPNRKETPRKVCEHDSMTAQQGTCAINDLIGDHSIVKYVVLLGLLRGAQSFMARFVFL